MEYLRVKTVAKRLQVTDETVRRMVRRGYLQGAKVGKAILIPESEVLRILTEGSAPRPRERKGGTVDGITA